MFIVPPKAQPRKPRTKAQLMHDGLCGMLIGFLIALPCSFYLGTLFYFYAVSIATIVCLAVGFLAGSGSKNFNCPWVIW